MPVLPFDPAILRCCYSWSPQKTVCALCYGPVAARAAQPWLIQAGLRGDEPGRVTPPGIWCLAAIKPAELCWGWNWQPLDTCSKNRTRQMMEVSDVKAESFLKLSFYITSVVSSVLGELFWRFLTSLATIPHPRSLCISQAALMDLGFTQSVA